MTNTNEALELLRAANPVASVAALDPSEVAASVAECGERVDAERFDRAPGVSPLPQRVSTSPRVRRILRPTSAFGIAFAVMVIAVLAATLVGRNGGPPAVPVPDTTVVTNTTLPRTPTTTPDVSTTVDERTLGGVDTVGELVYYSDGDVTLSMSVFFPSSGSGPWPVAVAYHTHCVPDCSADPLAKELASRGAVVFAPAWVPSLEQAEEYVDGALFDRAACAVGAAQAMAEDFGGDPRATTVIGQGGGEHPAAWVALGITRYRDCDEPVQYRPTGLVVGNPQFVFQQDFWDPAFDDPTSNARDTIDRFLNAERWETSDDLFVLTLATEYQGNSREVSINGADAWLADRDTTGTLAEDLADVAAFDDELILFADNARLFDFHLRGAGIDSSLVVDERTGWAYTAAWYDAIEALISRDQ